MTMTARPRMTTKPGVLTESQLYIDECAKLGRPCDLAAARIAELDAVFGNELNKPLRAWSLRDWLNVLFGILIVGLALAGVGWLALKIWHATP